MEDKSLRHFGILGMKWGVKRSPDSGMKVSSKKMITKKPKSEEHERAKQLKIKGVKSMSNAELKTYIDRMNLERQYKQLDKDMANDGKKLAKEILREIGKELIKETIKTGIKSLKK